MFWLKKLHNSIRFLLLGKKFQIELYETGEKMVTFCFDSDKICWCRFFLVVNIGAPCQVCGCSSKTEAKTSTKQKQWTTRKKAGSCTAGILKGVEYPVLVVVVAAALVPFGCVALCFVAWSYCILGFYLATLHGFTTKINEGKYSHTLDYSVYPPYHCGIAKCLCECEFNRLFGPCFKQVFGDSGFFSQRKGGGFVILVSVLTMATDGDVELSESDKVCVRRFSCLSHDWTVWFPCV